MTLSRQDLYDHDYDAFDHIPPKKFSQTICSMKWKFNLVSFLSFFFAKNNNHALEGNLIASLHKDISSEDMEEMCKSSLSFNWNVKQILPRHNSLFSK